MYPMMSPFSCRRTSKPARLVGSLRLDDVATAFTVTFGRPRRLRQLPTPVATSIQTREVARRARHFLRGYGASGQVMWACPRLSYGEASVLLAPRRAGREI